MLIFARSLQWNCNVEQSMSGQKNKDGHKNPVQVSIPAARVCANLLTTLKSHPVWEPGLLSIPAKQHPWTALTRRPGLQKEMALSTERSTLDGPHQRLLLLHFWQRSYCLFNFTFLQLKIKHHFELTEKWRAKYSELAECVFQFPKPSQRRTSNYLNTA